MTSAAVTVGADLLAIPDGIAGPVARIGIQATPSRLVAGSIDLADWPAAIAAQAGSVRVRIGDLAGAGVIQFAEAQAQSKLSAFLDAGHLGDPNKSRAQAASELWRRIFQPQGFDKLLEALPDTPDPALVASSVNVLSARTGDLQIFFDAIAAARAQPSLAAAPAAGRALAERIARWMRSPSAEALTAAAGAAASDPFAARADALARLRAEIELLVRSPEAAFAAEPELEQLRTMFREHRIALFGQSQPPAPQPEPAEEDWANKPADVASRKLAGLLSLPTLAHYFGLGVQIEIPVAAFAGRTRGAIAVEFAGDAPPEPAWTAFELDERAGYFGPAPREPVPGPASRLSRGFLDLSAKIADGSAEPRYRLATLDVVNMLQDLIAPLNRANGWEDEHFDELERRRRGIVLYDHGASAQLIADQLAEQQEATAADPRINFAEQLVKGVRPDFALAPRGATGLGFAADRWRPVTPRIVKCTDDLLDPAFYEQDVIRELAHRDHGFAAAPIEERTANGTTTDRIEDEMFAWAGESMAVSRGLAEGVEVCKDWDLGLDLRYDLPKDVDCSADPKPSDCATALPPLREGVGYVCGCRLVYVNGAGPTFEAARARYAADASILIGDGKGDPLVYPSAAVSAPQLHLKWNSPLVTAADAAVATPGETSSMLVIRDGAGEAVRLLTPPRLSFDGAELQGRFDRSIEGSPDGALSGRRGVWLFGPDGSFPEARFGARHGAIRWLDRKDAAAAALHHVPIDEPRQTSIEVGSPEYDAIEARQSRGTVAVLGPARGDAKDGAAFHPDRHGKQLEAVLTRTTLSPATHVEDEVRSFWSSGDPNDAVPLYLQFRDAGNGPLAIDLDDDQDVVNVDGMAVRLPLLRVRLPRAERCTLRLGALAPGLQRKALVAELVHAVEQPLSAPRFETAPPPPGRRAPRLGINAVTVSVRKDSPEASRAVPGLKSWAETVSELELSGADMLDWASDEGGDTTFFTGRIEFDRKSTGVIRCEAEWIEFDQATVARNAEGRWVRNLSRETAQLFRREVERGGDPAQFDILRRAPGDDPGEEAARHARLTAKPGRLRHCSYAFRDGRARELKTRVVATSAFTDFYPPDPDVPSGRDWTGRYELASSPFEDAPSVWTECTFRPPPPAIDRIMPLFRWSKVGGKVESKKRRAAIRISLDEGWYASGADEQLGIVLLEGNKPETVCGYEEGEFKAFHRFISRAGADPAANSAAVPIRLEPAHFPNALRIVDDVQLYLGEASGAGAPAADPTPSLAVKLATYRPSFSAEDGLYCDVEIDLGDAYMPFLQLGLVRFQGHAVKQLRLSHPTEEQARLLPERSLWIDTRAGRGERTVHVEGPGYAVPQVDPAQPAHQLPALDLRLLAWNELAKEWQGAGTVGTAVVPKVDAATGRYSWEQDFELPLDDWPTQHFALVAEEFERLPQDEPTGKYVNGRAEFKEVEGRRMTFAALQKMRVPQ